jgi:hypothetical protein
MTMPEATIAANLDEAFDIKVNLFSKLTFNPVLPVNYLTKAVHLTLGKAICLGIRADVSLRQNLTAHGGANSVDVL